MPANLHGVSPVLVERFKNVFEAFVNGVKDAIADAAQKPGAAESVALHSWQVKALPLLEKGKVSIQAAVASFEQGDVRPILVQAEDKRGLAKDLDGFPLTFAGPEHAQKLDLLETGVVTAAYQICAVAGIP
jgi:hypothetical protein